MKNYLLSTRRYGLAFIPLLLCGCRLPPLAQEQDTQARRLLSALGTGDARTVQATYASGSPDLHQYQTQPDFARLVARLYQRVGRIQSVSRTDVRVTRTMAAEKTSLIYRVNGDKGQADVKIYLTRLKGEWVLDGLRLGGLP